MISKRKKRALVSVTNKEGLQQLSVLVGCGWEIVSTGGTLTALQDLGIPCVPVEQVTGFPEGMDGRLKTLHPKIFGGILANRSKDEHLQFLIEHQIELFDMVIVNLYDFAGNPNIETIDIGGPSLLRAAAKNCTDVTVVSNPDDYKHVIEEIYARGATDLETRRQLAQTAFEHTAQYDISIAKWMADKIAANEPFATETAGAHQ